MKREIKLGFNSEQKLFRAYVELLQPLFKLRSREAEVFSQLLYYNYLKRDIVNLTDRFELIFSSKNKKVIMSNLSIKDSILQNTLSVLRKKNLIVNNEVPTKYLVYPTSNTLELVFKLKTDGIND